MPARDVTVTANFELKPPDHYKLYWAEWGEEPPPTFPATVLLEDQFGTFNVTVGEAWWFGNPVKKVHDDTTTPISDDNRHYTYYQLDYGEEEPLLDSWNVEITNQFNDGEPQYLTVKGPYWLAVPTQKEDHEMAECLDHLLVYHVVLPVEYVPEPIGEVDLHDQFQDELGVTVYEPVLFANPVQKTVLPGGSATPIKHDDEHYVYYPIDGEPFEKRIQIENQFGNQTLNIYESELLAVPSDKIEWEQPLNHFKAYWTTWGEEPPLTFPAEVLLEDQFISDWLFEPLNATVVEPFLFANPVEKRKMVAEEEVVTPVSDWKHHLTFYWINYEEDPQMWEVMINNQFGNNQPLQVVGPLWLAVPTGKLALEWPSDLNHYLVYYVDAYDYVPEKGVYLEDQFMKQETVVLEPEFFAVPAKKTHDGLVTDIKDDKHLLFYWLDYGEFTAYDLPIVNQFGEQFLDLELGEGLLGVPSDKIEWSGPYGPLPD
jgi:hypothetical protein